MSVLCDNYHTLSWHLVSSIFRIKEKEERETQDRKSSSEK